MKLMYFFILTFFTSGATIDAQSILSFDFEQGLPLGWQTENSWKIDSASVLKSEYFPFEGNSGKFAGVNDDKSGQFGNTRGKLITEFLDFTAHPDLLLSYDLYYFNGNFEGKGKETLNLYYSEDGYTWSLIDEIREEYKWQTRYFAVSSYIGGKIVKLAFEYNDGNNWNYGVGIDNILFEVQPEFKIISIPPVINYYQVSNPDEKASFKCGFIAYGKEPVTTAKFYFTIDNSDTFEIVSNDTVSVNSVFNFEIKDLGIGTHSVRSGIVLNNSFKHSNGSFEFNVFPPIPPYSAYDIDNVYHDLHSDLKNGKAVLLEFFASYSPDCKSAASILNKVWEDNGNGNDKFQIYSMSAFFYDDATTIQKLNWGSNFPVFAYSDYNKVLWNIFNNENAENIIPVSMLICPDTIDPGFSPISWKTIGYTTTLETDLDNAIKECIGKPDAVKTSPVSFLRIYPNPVKDMISISFSLKENLNIKVFITDMDGRTVKILSEFMVKNSEKISSDISELNSGPYFLNISTEKGVSSQKFIKI